MDFELSPEQRMLKDSVARFVQDEYEFVRCRAVVESEEGFSREHWRTFAELGWLGIAVPETYGGLGGDAVDIMIVMEAFGRGLVPEPYLTTAVVGSGLLRTLGSESQKKALLPKLVEGELLLAPALAEPQSRYDLHDVTTRAERTSAGWVLSGRKSVVLHGPSADYFIVSARTSGQARDTAGISLFLVPRSVAGVDRFDARTFDRAPCSELQLEEVELESESLIGDEGQAFAAVTKVVDEGIAAICAEAVGAMEAVHERTNEYLKTRTQFGQPIGQFQVLQHRMVDMFMELEQARSLTYLATLKLCAPDEERRRVASCAKAQMGKAGKFVGAQAVQLHGGMGMTDELDVSHYYKRLMRLDIQFGNAEHHLRAFTELTQ